MLVPLQGTLPGWPTAQEPTAVELLGLLVGVPLVVFIILALLVKRKDLIRAGRGESAENVDQPLWFGSAPADQAALAGSPDSSSATAIEGRRGRGVVESVSQVGGASARW
jgi:hypothetical protein